MLLPRSGFGASNTTGQALLETKKSMYRYFLDIRALQEPAFVTYMIANFSIFLGFYIPFFSSHYTPKYYWVHLSLLRTISWPSLTPVESSVVCYQD